MGAAGDRQDIVGSSIVMVARVLPKVSFLCAVLILAQFSGAPKMTLVTRIYDRWAF
jgi:hypothetical protein